MVLQIQTKNLGKAGIEKVKQTNSYLLDSVRWR